jgi:hypothetical protein
VRDLLRRTNSEGQPQNKPKRAKPGKNAVGENEPVPIRRQDDYEGKTTIIMASSSAKHTMIRRLIPGLR